MTVFRGLLFAMGPLCAAAIKIKVVQESEVSEGTQVQFIIKDKKFKTKEGRTFKVGKGRVQGEIYKVDKSSSDGKGFKMQVLINKGTKDKLRLKNVLPEHIELFDGSKSSSFSSHSSESGSSSIHKNNFPSWSVNSESEDMLSESEDMSSRSASSNVRPPAPPNARMNPQTADNMQVALEYDMEAGWQHLKSVKQEIKLIETENTKLLEQQSDADKDFMALMQTCVQATQKMSAMSYVSS